MHELAAALGTSPLSLPDPADAHEERVLLRESVRHAIEGLRSALAPETQPRRVWVQGEMGWRSSREVTAAMAKEDEAAGRTYRWFTSDELKWLVRLGYAEERIVRSVHVYRLTPAGAALQPLEWKPSSA